MAETPINGEMSASYGGATFSVHSTQLVLIVILLGLFGLLILRDIGVSHRLQEHEQHMEQRTQAVIYAFQQLADIHQNVTTLAQTHMVLESCRKDLAFEASRLSDELQIILMRLPSPIGGALQQRQGR